MLPIDWWKMTSPTPEMKEPAIKICDIKTNLEVGRFFVQIDFIKDLEQKVRTETIEAIFEAIDKEKSEVIEQSGNFDGKVLPWSYAVECLDYLKMKILALNKSKEEK